VYPPCKIFGDLHGQLTDMLSAFRTFNYPHREAGGDLSTTSYIFNGDFVDRGKHGLEIVTILFALKVCHPDKVMLVRGNHETRGMQQAFGFHDECKHRVERGIGEIWRAVWEAINVVFDYLPLAAEIHYETGSALVMHGGIGRVETIADIKAVPRPLRDPSTSEVATDLLWSDPMQAEGGMGFGPSARGRGMVEFGADVVSAFCQRNTVRCVIRSHQVVHHGYESFAGGKLYTVFSASNYCGSQNNQAAILEVTIDGRRGELTLTGRQQYCDSSWDYTEAPYAGEVRGGR